MSKAARKLRTGWKLRELRSIKAVLSTLIGCLWQRENAVNGGTVDGEFYDGKWGAYFAVPANTVLKANEANKIMTRTTANELITDESGRVTGVKADTV